MITGMVPDKRITLLIAGAMCVSYVNELIPPWHASSADMGVFCESTNLQQQQLKNTFPTVYPYLHSGQVDYFWCSPSDSIMSLLQVH